MHIGLVDLKWNGHHTPYVIYLSRYFTDQGHEVTFITHEQNPRLDELPELENLEIRTLDCATYSEDAPGSLVASIREQGYRVRQLLDIYNAARAADVDMVHLLYFDRTQVPLWLAGKITTQAFPPTVATLHRDAFLDNSDRSLSQVATQGITKLALHQVLEDEKLDCLTVHANSIRDRIIGAVPTATRGNTKMIPAPTPELSVDVSQVDARERLSLPTDEPLFLFFGALRYEKGPDILAEALQKVEEEMTVVFAGAEADFTQADVDEWKITLPPHVNIKDCIEFIPEDDVDYYFTAANALVLPYRRARGISGPLRRASMASTPIIANRDSDVGDVVLTNRLGETFDSNGRSLSLVLDEFAASTETTAQAYDFDQFNQSRHRRTTGKNLITIYEKSVRSCK